MTHATTSPEVSPSPESEGVLAPAPAVPTPESLAPTLEAVLLSSDKPLAAARLAEVLGLAPADEEPPATVAAGVADGQGDAAVPAEGEAAMPEAAAAEVKPKARKKKVKSGGPTAGTLIRDAVAILNTAYEQTGRSFRIESVAGGYRVMMLPEFAPAIAALQGARARTTLSNAALESLAIISYKQPITRARLEAIRGVACGEILRSLTERRLVTIVGRAEEVGRPLLYGTTKRFLELFGLASLKDLPSVEELKPKN